MKLATSFLEKFAAIPLGQAWYVNKSRMDPGLVSHRLCPIVLLVTLGLLRSWILNLSRALS